MDAQRQKPGGGRRRRRKARSEPRPSAEPILIAARRPNSPMLSEHNRKVVAASARPNSGNDRQATAPVGSSEPPPPPAAQPHKRVARIIQLRGSERDDREKLHQRLLDRLLSSEGRGAISRAAEEFKMAGFPYPKRQEVQLQLLEHFNEVRARDAMAVLVGLFETEEPIKRPVLEQRLRRLEEYADEVSTRDSAGVLRRSLRG